MSVAISVKELETDRVSIEGELHTMENILSQEFKHGVAMYDRLTSFEYTVPQDVYRELLETRIKSLTVSLLNIDDKLKRIKEVLDASSN